MTHRWCDQNSVLMNPTIQKYRSKELYKIPHHWLVHIKQ